MQHLDPDYLVVVGVDYLLVKDIPVTEKIHMQFRSEFFNAFIYTLFGRIEKAKGHYLLTTKIWSIWNPGVLRVLHDEDRALFDGEPAYPGAVYIVVSVVKRTIRDVKMFAYNEQKLAFQEQPIQI